MENLQTLQNQNLSQLQKQKQEEQRHIFIVQLLTPQAEERLMNFKTVKPAKAAAIEDSLIKASQSGALKHRVSEEELVRLLQKDSQARGEPKIIFKRHELDDQW